MSIPRGTTPTITLTFSEPSLDLTTADNVYVTIQCGALKITKTGADLEVQEKTISLCLTQEETLAIKEGKVQIQANWTASGYRYASEVATQTFSKQLLNEVLA